MIRFPVDLRVKLTKGGIFLTSWKPVSFKMPTSAAEPEILGYSCNHIHGILSWADQALTIIAIVNEKPGNGDFAKVMGIFESVAENWPCPLRVAAIWNNRLMYHLIETRGYQPDKTGRYSDALIKLPRLTV